MTKGYYIGSLKVILIFKLLLISVGVSAQVLKKPVLDFTTACGSSSSNNFKFKFDFSGIPFDANNKFIIQLSDANGNFDNAVDVGEITGENFTYFDIEGVLKLPTNTYGKGYKIQIKSTSPEMTGPESDSFEAYYVTSERLVLNDYKPVYLCGSSNSGTKISLNNIGDGFEYNWYRNGNLIANQRKSSITVNQSGEYYAAVDYGACGNVVKSNKIEVSIFNKDNVRLQGNDVVELCGSDTYEFVASVNNSSYIYKWYKDGKLIQGLPDYSPKYTTGTFDQYGKYYVEIQISNECKIETQKVTVKEKDGTSFTVNIVGNQNKVLLPDETILLTVTHNSASPSYQWYKDDVALRARDQIEMNVVEPGVYYLEVTDNSTSCRVIKKSAEYKIIKPVKLVPILDFVEYTPCESEETKVMLETVKAAAADGEQYDLTAEQLIKLGLTWYKNNNLIADFTEKERKMSSYLDNGEYYVETIIKNLSGASEKANVLLVPKDLDVEQSAEFLCPGSEIILTTKTAPGLEYNWFKGEEAINATDASVISVSDTGTYTLQITGSNVCSKTFTVDIKEFNGDAIKVSPSTTAVLKQDGTVDITASGGESYEWRDADGNLLSTTNSVEVSELGTYTLVAKLGDCDVVKEIKVVEDDGSLIIPNIVSPFNDDGVNDTWQIPNRYAFQQNVSVIIYNSRGKEVLNTTDYQNNWPEGEAVKGGMLFYFKVIRDQTLIKAGTLSVLK